MTADTSAISSAAGLLLSWHLCLILSYFLRMILARVWQTGHVGHELTL